MLQSQVIACRLCPRLVEFRERVATEKRPRSREETYWGRPVPGFGDPHAHLLILGLAPAAHGGNRTGRVFTGDPSARFLMDALYEVGFASQPTSEHLDDGLVLRDAYITATVKCVPPGDRPTVEESRNCRRYLVSEITLLSGVRAVLALGRIAFEGYERALAEVTGKRNSLPFRHGAHYRLGQGLPDLFASYHPSPRNTNTGRLKREEFIAVLQDVRGYLAGTSMAQL
ncbi:MAG: uracil-DNA glycosylase [Dehalococcoidia bacterium]|nr:uracil-DNA glycosylase [Dehalococcoidia bacterium]